MYALFSCVIFVLFCTVHSQRSIGDLCTIQSSGVGGECKVLNDCEKALQELLKSQKRPDICGFQGTQPIVCCEKEPSSTTATTKAVPQTSSRVPGETSKEKCKEYSQYVFQVRVPPVLAFGQPETPIKKDLCGHKVTKLIVGGDPASKREFPHQVAIGYEASPGDVRWGCGGTLISDTWVMTAGHCLYSRDFGESKHIRLGVISLKDEKNKQQFSVVERVKYPDYKPFSHYNDIGLLKFDKPARLNPYALPACLYLEQNVNAEKAIATGFGRTQFVGATSDDLLKVTLDLFDHDFCNSSYQISRRLDRGIDNDLQLCAGSLNEEKDTCQGDSGGPLQIYHINDDIYCMYDIIGVTSFGKACSGTPGVYTRVSHYIKWIEDHVWPEDS